MEINKCRLCNRSRYGKNTGMYFKIDYPNEAMPLTIGFVCYKCICGLGEEERENISTSLKKKKNITLYELEKLGLVKNLKLKVLG